MLSAAASRSQRGSTTIVPPAYNGQFMPPCMPVTWKNGSTDKATVSCDEENHVFPPTTVLITLRCVCMQPFGLPVVPDVYGMTHKSSGPAVNGPGASCSASNSFQCATCVPAND